MHSSESLIQRNISWEFIQVPALSELCGPFIYLIHKICVTQQTKYVDSAPHARYLAQRGLTKGSLLRYNISHY